MILFGAGKGQVTVKYKNRYGRRREYRSRYEGVIPWLERRHTDADSDRLREQIEGYMREVPCPACHGARLKPSSLAVLVGGRSGADNLLLRPDPGLLGVALFHAWVLFNLLLGAAITIDGTRSRVPPATSTVATPRVAMNLRARIVTPLVRFVRLGGNAGSPSLRSRRRSG